MLTQKEIFYFSLGNLNKSRVKNYSGVRKFINRHRGLVDDIKFISYAAVTAVVGYILLVVIMAAF